MSEYYLKCDNNSPYPPIKVEKMNLSYAQLLLEDYAGVNSEMTAITKYVYQSFICRNKAIAKALERISMDEMHHLDILGTLIDKLGGDPKYCDPNSISHDFWTAQYVAYEKNPCCFLKKNIAAEQAAIRNYHKKISMIEDQCVSEILERIIIDEQCHVKVFTQLLRDETNCMC